MAVSAARYTSITLSGDLVGTQKINATTNTDAPGDTDIVTLALGANTITCPTSGTTFTCATIIPPSNNATSITLKGVTGDTGIRLHNTDHSCISLHSSATSFVLTAAAEITGVRIIWT